MVAKQELFECSLVCCAKEEQNKLDLLRRNCVRFYDYANSVPDPLQLSPSKTMNHGRTILFFKTSGVSFDVIVEEKKKKSYSFGNFPRKEE